MVLLIYMLFIVCRHHLSSYIYSRFNSLIKEYKLEGSNLLVCFLLMYLFFLVSTCLLQIRTWQCKLPAHFKFLGRVSSSLWFWIFKCWWRFTMYTVVYNINVFEIFCLNYLTLVYSRMVFSLTLFSHKLLLLILIVFL